MEQAKGALASGASQAKSMAGNVDVQKLMPYLLAGGAGAVGGVALSGRRKARQGETRGQYLTRILRNAVITGALTGAGSYAAGEGLKKTFGKVDLENPITGTESDQGPLAATGRKALFGLPAAVISGGVGLTATVGGKRLGANPNLGEAEKILMSGLKRKHGANLPADITDVEVLKYMAKSEPDALRNLLKGDKALIHEAKRLGLNTHALGSIARKAHEVARIPSNLMGRTNGRRIGRSAIGLGAAFVPALAGAILSNRPE
jgi:hypothetical protein